MQKETMTSIERVECALNLEKPDRVPIWPDVTTSAAAALTDEKIWEITHQGFDAEQDLELKLFDEYGGWDAVNPALTADVFAVGGNKIIKATEESPEIQFVEGEWTKYEDYEIIAEIGWFQFVTDHLIYRVSDIKDKAEYDKLYGEVINGTLRGMAEYQKRGAFILYAQPNNHPFFTLSLARSMVKFTEDLFYRPEMVERALKKMTEEFIEFGLMLCEMANLKNTKVIEERAGGAIYPLRVFDRFWWPYTQQIVEAFHSRGIMSSFHLDTCWDKNLHYFKELPRKSAMIELDGTTNIFAAKDILRNHMCIASDIHPALMSLGKPEEVAAYCRKVIDEVGDDGGHILSTACGLPAAAKKENFIAMLETGKTYELSK